MTDKIENLAHYIVGKVIDDEEVRRVIHPIALEIAYKEIREERRNPTWVMDQEDPEESDRLRLYYATYSIVLLQLLNVAANLMVKTPTDIWT